MNLNLPFYFSLTFSFLSTHPNPNSTKFPLLFSCNFLGGKPIKSFTNFHHYHHNIQYYYPGTIVRKEKTQINSFYAPNSNLLFFQSQLPATVIRKPKIIERNGSTVLNTSFFITIREYWQAKPHAEQLPSKLLDSFALIFKMKLKKLRRVCQGELPIQSMSHHRQ